MKFRGLAAVLSAGLACATVAYFAADPITAVEAVPEPVPTPTATARVFAARDLGAFRQAIEGPALTRDAPGLIDPFNAVTPEAVGPSGAPVPLPVAPKSIRKEKVDSLGKAAAGALLTRPVSGRTTSKFGMRFHPILRVWKLHTGLDWAVPCGTPVGAAAPGTVVKAGWAGGNGIQVKVDHGMLRGHRVVTTYNHLSSIGVRVGQKIEALDGVGRVGSTGYSTGCHMHFEVIVDGQFTNPEPWLNGNPVVVDLNAMEYATVPTPTPEAPTAPAGSPTPSAIRPTTPVPTTSPTPSATPTPSGSASATPTPCPSVTPSASPSATPTPCVAPSPGASVTPSPTPSASPTPTPSPSPSPTPTASETPPGESQTPSPTEPAAPGASPSAPAVPQSPPATLSDVSATPSAQLPTPSAAASPAE